MGTTAAAAAATTTTTTTAAATTDKHTPNTNTNTNTNKKSIREKSLDKDWAVHQVEHALDYAVDSTFWLHISNGLNLQVVHHLFPQVGWGHYKALAPIIRDVCDEFGVTYATQPTFWAALRSHLGYLEDINEGAYGSVWVPALPQTCKAQPSALHLLSQLDYNVQLGATPATTAGDGTVEVRRNAIGDAAKQPEPKGKED